MKQSRLTGVFTSVAFVTLLASFQKKVEMPTTNNPDFDNLGITINPTSREVFIGDAKDYISNGSAYAFDKTGKLGYTLTAGINPGKIVLFNH